MIYPLRHNVSTLVLLTVLLVHPAFAQAQITLTGTVTGTNPAACSPVRPSWPPTAYSA